MAAQLLAFLLFVFLLSAGLRGQANHLSPGSKLYAGNDPLLSPSGIFAFGFYKQTSGFAVGIWLTSGSPNETVVAWTANRDDPALPSGTYLEFTREGLLIWINESAVSLVTYTQPAASALLLDSGNFVVYNQTHSVLWESFDYPTDTILPGQVLETDSEVSLVSSLTMTDRSSGRFQLNFQTDGNLVAYPVNTQQSSFDAYWSTGTFDFSFSYRLGELTLTEGGHLYLNISLPNSTLVHTIARSSYVPRNKTTIYRAALEPDGNFKLYLHLFQKSGNSMIVVWSALENQCEAKGYCGTNSYCSKNASTYDNCFCFPGFVYVDPEKKYLGCYRNFTGERFCERNKNESSLSYNSSLIEHMNIQAYPYAESPMIQHECGSFCLDDCNCWASLYVNGTCRKFTLPLYYATFDLSYPGTAFIKHALKILPPADQNLWPPMETHVSYETQRKLVVILAPIFCFLAFSFTVFAVISFFLYHRRAQKYRKLIDMRDFGRNKEFSLRSFSYIDLEQATDGFKEEIGSSSYGKIYEGIISDGKRNVAVKRLEKVDGGEGELIAEMSAMGQIHHKNVVQLLGFCIQGAKKLLVYELVKNRSLANILYDVEQRPTWKQCMKIALDIARGIRYLHEESETHIVHCDIKPENVLVDDEWVAKISNFGYAKLEMRNQSVKLAMVREKGLYSAPESEQYGQITNQVDVYNFGILLLEIIFCRSDKEIKVPSEDGDLFTWVYKCYMAKDLRKLFKAEEPDSESLERMLRVGLICIQDNPELRPSMKNVVLMLEGFIDIPVPHVPSNFYEESSI